MKAEGQKRGKKENVQGATTAKKDGSVNRSTWRISPMLCSKYDFFAFPHRCQSVSLNVIFRLYSTKRRDPKFSSAFCTMHGCSWCRPIAPHSANIFFFLPPPPFFGKTCTRQPRGVVKKKKKKITRQVASWPHTPLLLFNPFVPSFATASLYIVVVISLLSHSRSSCDRPIWHVANTRGAD